jgi:OOP family OmpA-OmpF porin
MLKKTVVVIAGIFVAGVANAQWYGGVSVGASDLKNPINTNVVTGATAFSFSHDTTDTAYKLQAGYQVNQYLAIEGGYVNLGKFKSTESVTAPVVGTISSNYKAHGWNVFAVGTLPLSQGFSAYGKLGTLYSTLKNDITTSGAVALAAGASANRKRTEWNWAYGLGLQYDISKTVAVRGEWERYDRLGDDGGTNPTGQHNFDTYSVGLNFKF